MWFRNLVVYRMPAGWNMDAAALAERLASHAFSPGSALDEVRVGWAAPRESDAALVHPVGGQMLLALRQEKKLLPAKVVAQVVKERAARIEADDGFRPGRKRLKELKEQVRDELLPRAFALASDVRAWIDPAGGWLGIEASSAARAEDVFGMLVKAVDGFPARSLRVADSVAGAMTAWLATGDGPAGFSVDQDAELKSRDGKSTIRYANQSPDADDVARHVKAGKQCTKLALTWADRVSFVLTDKLELRRVKALDVVRESAADAALSDDADERFDADMALMTGELSRLLADLVEALGGEPPAQAQGGSGGQPQVEGEAQVGNAVRADGAGRTEPRAKAA